MRECDRCGFLVSEFKYTGGDLKITYNRASAFLNRLNPCDHDDCKDLCVYCELSLYKWWEKYGDSSGRH